MVDEQLKGDGWIVHDGMAVPQTAQGFTEVMLRDGRQSYDRFGFWLWDAETPMGLDIVAYIPNRQSSMRLAA